MTKEELTELVNKVSDEVSGVYTDVSKTGNVNMDAVNMLARNMAVCYTHLTLPTIVRV